VQRHIRAAFDACAPGPIARDPDPFAPDVTLFEFVGSDQTWQQST
jgi:hypothetical protein